MRRMVGALLAAVVVVLAMLFPALQFSLPADTTTDVATITDYNATFDVAKDGTLKAVEDLTVDFPVDKHGIYRFFDVVDPNNAHVRYVPTDIQVTRDGSPDEVDLSTKQGRRYVVARVGNPNYTLYGQHQYRITYTIKGVLAKQGGGSQLYWNLIPQGWQMPIQKSEVTVHLPSAPTGLRCAVGFGNGQKCDSTVSGDGFSLTTGALQPHTPVTAQVNLPQTPAPGQVTVPWSARWDPVLGRSLPRLLIWLVLAVVAAVAGIVVGRSVRETEPAYPLMYAPPDGIGPAQAAYVMTERVTDDMFAATMLQMGNDGVATVSSQNGVLTLTGTGDAQAKTDEVTATTAMDLGVQSKSVFSVGKDDIAAGQQLKTTRADFNAQVRTWGRKSGYVDASVRPTMLTLVWGVCVLVAILAFFVNLFVISVVGLPFALFAAFGFPVILPTSRTYRTKKGRDLWSLVGGFYRVLSTPSSIKRFDFSGRKDLYLAYIPWAVAFGCAEAWAQKYRVEVGEEPPVPSYFNGGLLYYGLLGNAVSPANFSTDFNHTVDGAISSYQASIAPKSSGGGGFGGGFSGGGGGGGGGGGSW